MGDVPLIDADTFLQCGRPANIPEGDILNWRRHGNELVAPRGWPLN